jgi:hypothetical protein
MKSFHPSESERGFVGYVEATAHYLVRGGVWLSALGIGCGGLVYATTQRPPEHVDDGALLWVMCLGAVALGIALLVLSVICRGVARLLKLSTGTA